MTHPNNPISPEAGIEGHPDTLPGVGPCAATAQGNSISSQTEHQLAEANRRLPLVEAYQACLAEGLSRARAAQRVGADRKTLDRWHAAWVAHGFAGLLPKTHACGRPSALEKLGVTEELLKQIQGLHADTNSNTLAWRIFAASDRCPEPLAQAILDPNRCSKHAIPPSLRQATKLPESLKNAHHGPRRRDLKGMWTPRKVDILPGDIFTSDDTTPIWAWWVPWYESDEYPFGVKLLQGQLLPIMDVASQCVIAFVLIAREQSSYRAADIWRLFGHTFDTIGLPRLGFQLERGSWEANIIRGQEIEFKDGEVSLTRRVGGLRQLPTNITEWHRTQLTPEIADCFPKTLQTWPSFLPKSKSIEGWFNRSQNLEGTIWGCLGRDQMRKPFEATKKQYEKCKRGAADPREHFLSQEEMLKRLRATIEFLNNEPMEGEVFRGVPRMLFDQGVKERPLFHLPDESRYLFARDWKVLTITQGWARVRLTDEITSQRYSLFYQNGRRFGAELEGKDVVVYYDRENFEQPAQIHAAYGREAGEWLCSADYFERVGSFLDGDRTGHDIKKAWRNAVMSAYATIMPHAPSRQLPPEIAARRKEAAAKPEATPEAAPVRSEPHLPAARPQPESEPAITGSLRLQKMMAGEWA